MSEALVYVVDDEEAICDSVGLLLKSVRIACRSYSDPGEFLAQWRAGWRGCLLLDVRMPRMSGMEVHRVLKERGNRLPVIFMTGHGDVPMAVEAMRAGALDFLQKPFKDDELISRVQRALAQDAEQAASAQQHSDVERRYASLTPREREIARCLVDGASNKVIAIDLGLSERTVELHRAHIMQKMNVRSLAQLVQLLISVQPDAE
ncbi:response regulator transcription factor [Solimonas terrae]|uniref:Response regulator transcription factor n=1 Tax=Solimonas terrae TaxID=1396819 RepID=A0A6M2BLK1_9GAMM|nr:response regulator [Solimonas terrae]NGY03201.1 response regulator transcription factor [Solimonas terrae]